MGSIVTFEERFPGATMVDHAARFPSSVGDLSLPADGVDLVVQAVARVNAGRWIADCPQVGCGGAEYASFNDPRLFCCECRNAGVGGVPVQIIVPDQETREAIEQALMARVVPATRNWVPGETVADLLAENNENGVG